MALYHFNCTVRSRGSGSNAVAIAAYNSGENLKDEKTGETKYYKNKRDTVIYNEIMLPENAPSEYKSRQNLWNSVEKESNRKDAQLVRSYNIACQQEFTRAENIELLRIFCDMERQAGKCVDLCVHDPGFHGHINDAYLNSLSVGNLHGHLETTMTSIDAEGKWNPRRIERFVYVKDDNGDVVMEPALDRKGVPKLNKDGSPVLQKKRIPIIDKRTGKQKTYKGRKLWKKEIVETDSVRWNSDEFFANERSLWEKLVNTKFKEKYEQLSAIYSETQSESDRLALIRITDPTTGGPIQISKESYEEQGLDKIPSIHLGYKAAAMEKRGIETDRGNINREIKAANDKLIDLSTRYSDSITNAETLQKEKENISEQIANESSLIEALQQKNVDIINSAVQIELQKAERSLGTPLSNYERKDLQPLCEKHVLSESEDDRQQIVKAVKNMQTERNAKWLVDQTSQYFSGALDTANWNRLFNEAKTAYMTNNFGDFSVAAIDELSKNIKRRNAPQSVMNSINLVQITVDRELTHDEFCKVAQFKFQEIFDQKNRAIWGERLAKYALYKQAEGNVKNVMQAEMPSNEDDLKKLQRDFGCNRSYLNMCNDYCKDINEPYINPEVYANKEKAVESALDAINKDKGVITDWELAVNQLVKTRKALTGMEEVNKQTELVNALVKRKEAGKVCMARLHVSASSFWLEHTKSFDHLEDELQSEKKRIQDAKEQIEERKKAEQEKAEKQKKREADLKENLRLSTELLAKEKDKNDKLSKEKTQHVINVENQRKAGMEESAHEKHSRECELPVITEQLKPREQIVGVVFDQRERYVALLVSGSGPKTYSIDQMGDLIKDYGLDLKEYSDKHHKDESCLQRIVNLRDKYRENHPPVVEEKTKGEEVSACQGQIMPKQSAERKKIEKIKLTNIFPIGKVSASITWEDGKTTTYSADKYNQMWSEHCEDIQDYNGKVDEKNQVTIEKLKAQVDRMTEYTLKKQRSHGHGLHGPKR